MSSPEKSFEEQVIDRAVSEDEYVERLLKAAAKRMRGEDIDLNRVADDIHDQATIEHGQSWTKEDRRSDEGDCLRDMAQDSGNPRGAA